MIVRSTNACSKGAGIISSSPKKKYFQLPKEMIRGIFSFLDFKDLCRLSATSRALRVQASNNTTWSQLYLSLIFRVNILAHPPPLFYKNYFKNYFTGGFFLSFPKVSRFTLPKIFLLHKTHLYYTHHCTLFKFDLHTKTASFVCAFDEEIISLTPYHNHNQFCIGLKSGAHFVASCSEPLPRIRNFSVVIDDVDGSSWEIVSSKGQSLFGHLNVTNEVYMTATIVNQTVVTISSALGQSFLNIHEFSSFSYPKARFSPYPPRGCRVM